MQVLLTQQQIHSTVSRLAQDLTDRHGLADSILFVGIQRGGVVVAEELIRALRAIHPEVSYAFGQLDITFYRDDFRQNILAPDVMNLPFSIENKIVVLIDDILFTGRTIKAALDALLDYGRPARVELCVLVDRREHRQFPIQADYVGLTLPTEKHQKLKLVDDQTGGYNLVLLES